jgi:DNA-binding NtrC family response regulator
MSVWEDKMAKVLLIDEEERPREKNKVLFENCGHDVITAISASEALKKLIEEKPGIVVIGACMIDSNPVMEAKELVDKMRKVMPEVSIIIRRSQKEEQLIPTKANKYSEKE